MANLTPVFYTSIRPAIDQTEFTVIRMAHVLGYEMVPFTGFTDIDIGPSGMHGPKYNEASVNRRRIKQIQDACEINNDWPLIRQS